MGNKTKKKNSKKIKMKLLACIQLLSVVWSTNAVSSAVDDSNRNGEKEHKASSGFLRRGTLAYEDVMSLNLLLDSSNNGGEEQNRQSNVCTTTETVVYTVVTYTGGPDDFDFDFGDTESLISLESNFNAAYNNFECANDPNVFKTVISSFVFSADFPANQYLIGSRVSNTAQYFCGNNNLESLSYVPAWY